MKKIFATIVLLSSAFFAFAGENPEFPGGESAMKKFVSDNTRYPQIAEENGVEGIVVVGFMVSTDGSLKDLKVLKLIDPDLEKEALRVVGAMPAWIPAEKNGSPVEAPAKVDVPFILE